MYEYIMKISYKTGYKTVQNQIPSIIVTSTVLLALTAYTERRSEDSHLQNSLHQFWQTFQVNTNKNTLTV